MRTTLLSLSLLLSSYPVAAAGPDPIASTRHIIPTPVVPLSKEARFCATITAAVKPEDRQKRIEALRNRGKLIQAAGTPDKPKKPARAADSTPAPDPELEKAYISATQTLMGFLEDPSKLDSYLAKCTLTQDAIDAPGAAAPPAPGGSAGWQSTVINGLASFITSRTEAELSLWIVDYFVTNLCTNADSAKAAWFPEACKLVQNREGGEIPGAAFISALREDIEQLPYAILRDLLVRQRIDEVAIAHLVDTARALGGAIVAIRSNDPPWRVLAGLGRIEALRSQCNDPRDVGNVDLLGCTLAATGEIIAAIDELGLSSKKLDEVILGGKLLDNPIVHERLTRLYGAVDRDRASALLVPIADFRRWLDTSSLVDAPDAETRRQNARRLTKEILRLLDGVIAAAYAPPKTPVAAPGASPTGAPPQPTAAPTQPKIPHGVDHLRLSLQAADAMLCGDYGEGVRKLVELLDKLLEHAASLDQAQKQTLMTLRRYVMLAADLAAAKDSEAVHAAIQAAAAPVGGWRIKRQAFTVSFSALAGLTFGGEYLPRKGEVHDVGLTIAPMAAVGIDLSAPIRRGWTVGSFLSILDLGQLVSARLYGKQEDASTASEVDFISVLSPGAYLKFGIGRTPFVFGAGLAYAPNQRGYIYKSTAPEATTEKEIFSAMRFGMFVAVDVTIFPFVKPRRRSPKASE